MNNFIATANLRGLVSLMRDAGDDGSHIHQPDTAQVVGHADGMVVTYTAGDEYEAFVDTWELDAQPCTHPGCRCLLRWLPDGTRHSWRAVATA